jgi:hypothetical protein
MAGRTILVNRAPVLTLWAAVVAERLGHPRATALTLGKAVAGLNAQSKGRRLGIYEEAAKGEAAQPGARKRAAAPERVALLGRGVPVAMTPAGLRAVEKDRPVEPAAVERYLEQKFGDALADARTAMSALAASYPRAALAEAAYGLYEQFRPAIPAGVRGWGAKGELDLGALARLGPKSAKGR